MAYDLYFDALYRIMNTLVNLDLNPKCDDERMALCRKFIEWRVEYGYQIN